MTNLPKLKILKNKTMPSNLSNPCSKRRRCRVRKIPRIFKTDLKWKWANTKPSLLCWLRKFNSLNRSSKKPKRVKEKADSIMNLWSTIKISWRRKNVARLILNNSKISKNNLAKRSANCLLKTQSWKKKSKQNNKIAIVLRKNISMRSTC